MPPQQETTAPLEDILDEAVHASDGDKTSIGDLLDSFGSRSIGPILVLIGLMVMIPPIGAVPGVPAVLGVVVVLFTLQFVFGRDHIWLPQRVEKVSIKTERLRKAQDKAQPVLARLDHLFTSRLGQFTGPVSERAAAIVATLLGLFMIPLELIPAAVSAPGLGLLFFGIGLMAKDGLMMLLGYVFSIGTLGLALYLLT
ncbi:exopolysaccharide biosynthesis protein [Parvularcula sp. LCG005]|uniref:exopolysaccharide biosynthesis protein n=1 Tax=Parvularcula sp. LCG005 TaxID=3078805 RepID=UPI0029432D4C|nr:exopolysaccharide biosynthesis protein [Parvularcula sp. LCG005]WOI52301.1 exopolysaccharide biosynthesis protein [Parvularcula sp. LCG005]